MATLLQLLNLAACFVILAAAMGSYLRHGVPECAGHHYNQLALVMVAVGAFGVGVSDARQLSWWELSFRLGLAMVAARHLAAAMRQYRKAAL